MSTIPQSEMAYIYGLFDPRNGYLRYIGKTARNNPLVRFTEHLYKVKYCSGHCQNWIRSLLSLGLKPEIEILEYVPASEASESERFWISYFRFIGCNLTNRTEGGEGCTGMIHSIETRAKIGARSREVNTGRKHKPESIAKIAAAKMGNSPSEETRRKISEANRRRIIPDEWRAKMSAAHLGKPFSESHKANLHKSMMIKPPFVRSYEITPPVGPPFSITNLAKFCRENGLSERGMRHVVEGTVKKHRGYHVRKIE